MAKKPSKQPIEKKEFDLEDFKKGFSNTIAKTVDNKLTLVEEALTNLNKSNINDVIQSFINNINPYSIKIRYDSHITYITIAYHPWFFWYFNKFSINL
mgnify:CR=1 FL=1